MQLAAHAAFRGEAAAAQHQLARPPVPPQQVPPGFKPPELLAAGARIWRTACRECNYWLSEKACAGTVLDYIGGR